MASSGPTPSELMEGATLAGKYRLVQKLGVGGMCVIWEAEHLHLGQSFAVKVLKPDLADDKDCVARFEREAKAAAQLRSPNVARVVDVDWLPSGVPYITMELLIGHDLGKELADVRRLPVATAVDYVRQACDGVAEAHALGIVHRDIKPENLFLTDLGERTERKLVKLLDFGIAKTLDSEARRLTAPDAVFGTVDYMSPEQIRSASTVDHRSDLWSLGVILYELVTGRTPYAGDARSVIAQIVTDPVRPPTALVPDLSPGFVSVVMKALAKDREKRFQTAEELRDALAPFSELEPITNVIARLPAASMPRRTSTQPPRMSPEAREQRTHASWETASQKRAWSRPWLFTMFAVACLAGALALVLRMGGPRLFGASATATATASGPATLGGAAPATPPAPLAPVDAPSAAIAIATGTTGTTAAAAAAAVPPAATATASTASSASAAKPAAKRPLPAAVAPRPPPRSDPPTPRLPDHL